MTQIGLSVAQQTYSLIHLHTCLKVDVGYLFKRRPTYIITKHESYLLTLGSHFDFLGRTSSTDMQAGLLCFWITDSLKSNASEGGEGCLC